MTEIFDNLAEPYDRWYDQPAGRAIFRAELACLRALCPGAFDGWIEVGAGAGRFAQALDIRFALDPSASMLALAAKRGVHACLGEAGRRPFARESFNGVLLAMALCFIDDATSALRECCRILRGGGCLLLGTVTAESAWGRAYKKKADRGHPIYSCARFRTLPETVALAEQADFTLCGMAGTLYWKPGAKPDPVPRIERQSVAGAGFVALLLEKSEARADPLVARITEAAP